MLCPRCLPIPVCFVRHRMMERFLRSALCRRDPVAFRGKGIGRQADATWQTLSIKEFPFDGCALDPQLQQFPILAFAYPGCDSFLSIFVCGKDTISVLSSHLSTIPVTVPLRILQVSMQLLREFCERTDRQCQSFLHRLTPYLQRIGQIL